MTTTLADLDQNLHQCWRCSHCKWVPAPLSHRFSRICPSVEWGNFHTYSGGGKLITAYALARGAVPYTAKTVESVFACTMCGGCDVD
jgi:Fe-S oxidoreductase